MLNNFFTKCPSCGHSIEKDSSKCNSCGVAIASSFGSDKNSYAMLLGRLAVQNKMISEEDFELVYAEYLNLLNTEFPEKIEDLFISKNLVPAEKITKLIATTLRSIDKRFCSDAVKKGIITQEQAKKTLEYQNQLYQKKILKSAADILKEQNALTEEQAKDILKAQVLSENSEKNNGYKKLKDIWEEEDKKKKQELIRKNISQKNLKIARLGVKYNYFSKEDLEEAADKWSATEPSENKNISFLDFLIKEKLLDRKKLTLLNINFEYANLKEKDVIFCKLAIVYKFIQEKTAEQALKKQNAIFRESHKLFPVAEILHKNNALKKQQIYRILTEQKRFELAKRYYQKATTDTQNSKSSPASDFSLEEKEKAKAEIKIEISEDNLEAKLYPPDKKTDIEDIKNAIREKGINYGLRNEEEIKNYIKSGSQEPLAVAMGKKPVEPVNAEIKCHFSENYLNVGSIDEEGNIDFMDRGEVPFVDEGELLAEKIPMKEGAPGTDIFSNAITVEEPKDIMIKAEQNTRIDEATSKVYSTLRGKPHISVDGKISVLNVHEIKGDVDFRTGHIEFNGNIIIHGTVKPGFKVSGNDITVEEISGGEIEAKGFLEVKSGLSRGKIFAEQGLSAKFINQSKINALGNISVEKEILESDIKTSGIFTAPSGKIISSVISAKGGIEAKQIGTEVSAPSTLEIGSSAYLDHLLNPLNEELETLDKTLEELQNSKVKESEKNKKAHIEIAEKAQIQDKANQALKKLNEHFDLVSMKGDSTTLEDIQEKIDNLTKKVNEYEKIMENLFYTQDSSQEAISEIENELEKYENQKQELKQKIEALENYDSSLSASPVLIVHGTIEKGTKVAGLNSLWKVHETTKKIRAYEIQTKDQDGNPLHIVKVDKPK